MCKCSEIIQIGNDIKMSGNFATEKTLNKMCASFYWPSMKHDVAVYIAT